MSCAVGEMSDGGAGVVRKNECVLTQKSRRVELCYGVHALHVCVCVCVCVCELGACVDACAANVGAWGWSRSTHCCLLISTSDIHEP
jgi:hypothetical protein